MTWNEGLTQNPKYETKTVVGMDLPVIADLPGEWALVAHPNGASIATETFVSVLYAASKEDGVPEEIRKAAVRKFERFAWERLRDEFWLEDEA